MKYFLTNSTPDTILIGGVVPVAGLGSIELYDDQTFDMHPFIQTILNSTENVSANIEHNLNYNIDALRLLPYFDSSYRAPHIFYQWLNEFKIKYNQFDKYRSTGIVDIKLDFLSGKIIIGGNKPITIDNIPDNIPATKISNGIINNQEFDTLEGIDTSKTIQAQLNEKANTVHNHTYMFFLSYPSLTWTLNHNLNVKPAVELRDLDGNIVIASGTHLDNNTIFLKFARAIQVYANLTI